MRESESLSIIVRSRLYHLPTLEVMASNDVVLGDKGTFAKAFAVPTEVDIPYTCGLRDSYQSLYIVTLYYCVHFDANLYTSIAGQLLLGTVAIARCQPYTFSLQSQTTLPDSGTTPQVILS